MKKIAILLHSNIKSDYRVIKTMRTLAKEYEVFLFFHGKAEDVLNHFYEYDNIRCIAIEERAGLIQKALKHTFFCYEYTYIVNEVFRTKENFDLVWANDLPMLYPARVIAKKLNAKLIYDSHEIYNETINQFFIKGNNAIKNLAFEILIKIMKWHGEKMELTLLKKTDIMFTVNESLKNYFKQKYKFEKIEVLMNLPYAYKGEKLEAFNFRKHFSWPNHSIILIYQGVLNFGRGLELMIDSFKFLDDKFRLVILGNGILKDILKKKVQQLKLESNIGFHDAVPLAELPKYTSSANIGLNLLEDFNLSKKLASPNKLFEYIHAGIPVVASRTIENERVFEHYKIGELCENTPIDIADKIKAVYQTLDSFKYSLLSAKQNFSWEHQEVKLLTILN